MTRRRWMVVLLMVLAIGILYIQQQGRLWGVGTCDLPEGGGTCQGTWPLQLPENTSFSAAQLNVTPSSRLGQPVFVPNVSLSPNPAGTGTVVIDDTDAGRPGGSPLFSKEPPKEELAPEGGPARMALLGLRRQLYLFNATSTHTSPNTMVMTVRVSARVNTNQYPRISVVLYRVTLPYAGGWRLCTQLPCTGQELWNLTGSSGTPLNLQPLLGATLFTGARITPGTVHTQDLTVTLNASQLFSPADTTAFVVAYTMTVASTPGGQEPETNLTVWPRLYPTDVIPAVGGTALTMHPGVQTAPFQTEDVTGLANALCQRPLNLSACSLPIAFDASEGGLLEYLDDTTLVPEACSSAWNCTEWSDCAGQPNGSAIQFRTCTDLHGCFPQTNIPLTEQACTMPGNQTDCADDAACTGLNMTICANNQTIQSCVQANASCLAWANTTCGPQSVCIDEVLALSGVCYYYGPPPSGGGGGGGGGPYVPPAPAVKQCPGPDCPVLTSLAWVLKLPAAFPWVLLIGATGMAWYLEKRQRRRR